LSPERDAIFVQTLPQDGLDEPGRRITVRNAGAVSPIGFDFL
jgi:hypothetical protein